ncbi:uL15 family ribosomal protein [Candidatus Kaiserbacteria bacterium]|nr:uL15 family ribosomal protein [Candidatus Kaiserbacteria bacterium]
MAHLGQLKRTGKRAYRRIGRGQGSSRGKQSGRGGKGQTARAGHKIRPAFRDIIKKLPKRRGYGKNRGRTVVAGIAPLAVSVSRVDARMENGAEITFKSLVAAGITGRRNQKVKLVGGNVTKKFTVKGIPATATARAAIEKAGGTLS